jgi:hypothetical protein
MGRNVMADVGNHIANRIGELSRRHWKSILSLALVLVLAIQIWLIVASYTDPTLASTWIQYAVNVISTLQTLTLLWGALGLILALISTARVVDDAYARRLEEASSNLVLYRQLWQSKTHELAKRRIDLFAKINQQLPAAVVITNITLLVSVIVHHQFSSVFLRFYLQQIPSLVFATILLAGYETERRRSKSIGNSAPYQGISSEPCGDAMPDEQEGVQNSGSCN